MIYVYFIILFIYVVLISWLIFGFTKKKLLENKELLPKTKFTIVVPFRNEAENLPKLLHSISLLEYPKNMFEVILVDDDSEEEFKITNYGFQINCVENNRKSNSPKKDAIETAIEIAKNDWIITTDADCVVQKKWLYTLDNYIQSENKKMVAAGVCYLPATGFLHAFQTLDFLSLQGATIGSFGIQKPFMCNGANFAYQKDFFKFLKGFEGNENIASGDDVFLLQKVIALQPKNVGFCMSRQAVVATKSVGNWKELFFQRVRWAAKSSGYHSVFGKILALSVFATNLFWVLGFGFWLAGYLNQNYFMFFVALKFLVDFVLLFKTASFFQSKLHYVLACSFIYPFFSSAVAFYSLFGKYTWKERVFKK